jgi:hypothetical protein
MSKSIKGSLIRIGDIYIYIYIYREPSLMQLHPQEKKRKEKKKEIHTIAIIELHENIIFFTTKKPKSD